MSQNRNFLGSRVKSSFLVGIVFASSAVITEGIADEVVDNRAWVAPAPMGPYGGHFDFAAPSAVDPGSADQPAVQAGYAIYQQKGELPVINASYATYPEASAAEADSFRQDELAQIDPAWSLGEQNREGGPVGIQGATEGIEDVWALGEIHAQHLPQLLGERKAAAVVEQTTAALELSPCRVAPGDDHLTSAETPYQEAIVDEFETSELDMEQVAFEADQLSRVEEGRDAEWNRPVPIFYPTFMPEYALGVRRANAMDPLALIPQMRSPVQYFGFQQ